MKFSLALTHLSVRLNANDYEEHARQLVPFAEQVLTHAGTTQSPKDLDPSL